MRNKFFKTGSHLGAPLFFIAIEQLKKVGKEPFGVRSALDAVFEIRCEGYGFRLINRTVMRKRVGAEDKWMIVARSNHAVGHLAHVRDNDIGLPFCKSRN